LRSQLFQVWLIRLLGDELAEGLQLALHRHKQVCYEISCVALEPGLLSPLLWYTLISASRTAWFSSTVTHKIVVTIGSSRRRSSPRRRSSQLHQSAVAREGPPASPSLPPYGRYTPTIVIVPAQKY
jgi:hypothetical protein